MIDVEKDLLLRQIRNAIRGVQRLLLKSQTEERKQDLAALFDLIDEGNIGAAEDTLFELADIRLSDALGFYDYLNGKDDAFLEQNGFSRGEIMDGIRDFAARFGAEDAVRLFFAENAEI